jgi:hypothetical protein
MQAQPGPAGNCPGLGYLRLIVPEDLVSSQNMREHSHIATLQSDLSMIYKTTMAFHTESPDDEVDENKFRFIDGSMQRDIGEILVNIDNQNKFETEDWIKKAIKADGRNGMMWHLGRDYALYAELLKRKSDQLKAKENLSKAIEILKECGADGWVGKYEKELTAIS